MRKMKVISVLLAAALVMSSCSGENTESKDKNQATSDENTTSTVEPISKADITAADMFSSRDTDGSFEESSSVKIQLKDKESSSDSKAVTITDNVITIKDEGVYLLSGTLTDGRIEVAAENTDKVQLVLNGVTISSKTSAPIYVSQADKVFITLKEGTENTISNGGSFTAIDDNNIDSVIFSKDDLTLNGTGSLTIQSPAGHGIVSKDDLVVGGGTYKIEAASHGITGKDSVRIADGNMTITSGKDGIHAENADDATLGFVYLANGTYNLTTTGDGISGTYYTLVENGTYTIKTSGESAKGIKATNGLVINDGTFSIDATDDAIHSNGNVEVYNGTYTISSGDDGIHADATLTVKDGAITITKSYEGLAGNNIVIESGIINLTSSDDGLNAAGGNDQSGFKGMGRPDQFNSSSDSSVTISGGTLTVNAQGDGLDSNGALTISGGTIYVSGPTNGGNGALDYGGEGVITGGTIIAAGSSGMAQNFGTNSTQGAIMVNIDKQSKGSTITLKDANGKELLSWQPEKEYSSVVVSTPNITKGSTYTLTAGTSENTITMENIIYGEGMMGGPGGFKGDANDWTPGTRPEGMPSGEPGEFPEGMPMPSFTPGEFPEGMPMPSGDPGTRPDRDFPGKAPGGGTDATTQATSQ